MFGEFTWLCCRPCCWCGPALAGGNLRLILSMATESWTCCVLRRSGTRLTTSESPPAPLCLLVWLAPCKVAVDALVACAPHMPSFALVCFYKVAAACPGACAQSRRWVHGTLSTTCGVVGRPPLDCGARITSEPAVPHLQVLRDAVLLAAPDRRGHRQAGARLAACQRNLWLRKGRL